MILISVLKQLQNIAAFHNEERNHRSMWEEEGEEGKGEGGRGGGGGGRGGGGERREKKRRDNVKESRGEGRERGCVHVLLESYTCSLSMYMMYMYVRTWTCTCFLSSILFHFSFSSYLPPLPSLSPPSLPVELTSSFTEATCKSD